ncbi:hypothetical protein [Streptomyces sp. NPDC054837]
MPVGSALFGTGRRGRRTTDCRDRPDALTDVPPPAILAWLTG